MTTPARMRWQSCGGTYARVRVHGCTCRVWRDVGTWTAIVDRGKWHARAEYATEANARRATITMARRLSRGGR
jgi:hypothetical protein